MSGFSGAKDTMPMEMVLHNIRFYDINHLHDSVGQDSSEDKREFHGKTKDVLRQKMLS